MVKWRLKALQSKRNPPSIILKGGMTIQVLKSMDWDLSSRLLVENGYSDLH
jgi:hypothetical protein